MYIAQALLYRRTVMPPVAVAVTLTSPTVPPYWALLERELLQGISDGCVEFFEQ